MTTAFEEAYLGALDVGQVLSTLTTQLPQTQKDITKFAQAADYLQSPEFKTKLEKTEQDVSDVAVGLIALQTLATIAIVGSFGLALATFLAKKKKGVL